MTVTTVGSEVADTILYAYEAVCGTEAVGCNDDTGGWQSSITFDATEGTTYFFLVEEFGGNAFGAITLNFTRGEPVEGDSCDDAVTIPTDATTFDGGLDGTIDIHAPGCSGAGGPEAVFMWTSDVTGTMTIDTFGSEVGDTILYAHEGVCGADEDLACNDDTDGLQSLITFEATAETVYYLFVEAWSGAGTGGVVLNLTRP